ncbi:MAG: hypothetical protein GX489_06120 [Firmicutes bacterium]|nr:hypothetical protein [Bacillota bacterium]
MREYFSSILWYLLLIVILVVIGNPVSIAAKSVTSQPRLVILCVDGLRIQDVVGGQLPQLESMFLQGTCALLNTNVAGGANLDSAYLTLGTGTRAKVIGSQPGYMVGESLPTEEGTITEVQERRTGSGLGAVLQPELAALTAANANLGYTVQLGALGTALEEAGYKVAIIGCADTDIRERPLVHAFMNSKGAVPYGFVGSNLLTTDSSGPYGFWTSTEAVLEKARNLKQNADLVVIEWADIYRAEKYAARCLPEQAAKMRWDALNQLNQFVGQLLLEFSQEEYIIAMVTPFPSKSDPFQAQRLAPIAVWGPGVAKGLLTSATTRRPGLIANIDIAPSILAYCQLPAPATIIGRPISIVPTNKALSVLEVLEQRAAINYQQRPVVLRLFIVYLIVVLALSVASAVLHFGFLDQAVHRLLLSGIAVPLIFLVLPLLPPLSLAATVTITAMLAAIPAVATFNSISSKKILWWVAGATVFVLILDVFSGQNLVSSSLLGYCFISGARYYGLGNEYMGIFIGALLTFVGVLFEYFRFCPKFARLFMLGIAIGGSYFLSANWLGANAGGTIAFAGGACMAYLWLDSDERDWRKITGSLIGVIVLLLILILADWRLLNKSSHIGRALEAAAKMGPQVLLGIIQRKAHMNIKLLRYSLWSRVLLMFIAALSTVFFGPYRNSLQLKYDYPLFTPCLRGTLVAAIIALVANDSGVVAAATVLLFPTAFLILLFLSVNDKNNVKISKN